MSEKKYEIVLSGCDDCSSIEICLTEKEAQFIAKIANQINKENKGSCQPSIGIKPVGGNWIDG